MDNDFSAQVVGTFVVAYPDSRYEDSQSFQQQHCVQMCGVVHEAIAAAEGNGLDEYLRPIPVTRLRMVERAFREIGATQLASAARSAQYSLTRIGGRATFAQAVNTLTAQLLGRTEDIGALAMDYMRTRGAVSRGS